MRPSTFETSRPKRDLEARIIGLPSESDSRNQRSSSSGNTSGNFLNAGVNLAKKR